MLVQQRKTQRAPRRPAAAYDVGTLINTPQQKRSQELTLRILKAAEAILRRHGLEGFTINAVAREAGVSVGGLYGRFENREELIAAIHKQMLEHLVEHTSAVLSGKFASLADLVSVFAVSMVDFFELKGELLPLIRTGKSAGWTNVTERRIRERVIAAAAPFRTQIVHVDAEVALKMVVHLIAASVIRERLTDRDRTDRAMGWDTLRAELPRMARAYLLSPLGGEAGCG